MQHVFLVGAKSLGAYGGYETFINKLTEYHQNNKNLKYHVACKANGQGAKRPEGAVEVGVSRYSYHNADCFEVIVPEKIGSAQAIYYDCVSLAKTIDIIKKDKIETPIVYVMACRIGPFFYGYVNKIKKLGGRVFLNPDGHEWKRSKWSKLVRLYWKASEKIMVKKADLIICDSINIEKYIKEIYGNVNTTFIAYGAETRKSIGAEVRYEKWLLEKDLVDKNYYLAVGRLVPENNYETMIREYMKAKSKKDFVIITNINNDYIEELNRRTGFRRDVRIKFVGTVYDAELLMKIREQAYGYIHGHEVGGTNPSLIEALASTELNLLLKVNFNEEVGGASALYWTKENGSLAELIDKSDQISDDKRSELGDKAKKRVKTAYSWQHICDRYAEVFIK